MTRAGGDAIRPAHLPLSRDDAVAARSLGLVEAQVAQGALGQEDALLDGDGQPEIIFTLDNAGSSDDWLYIKSYQFLIDGNNSSIFKNRFKRDHTSRVWEWCDIKVGQEQYKILKEIASSQTAIIRFTGKNSVYFHDVTLSFVICTISTESFV